MSRRAQTVYVAIFLLVITIPLALFVVGVRPELTDNRAIAEAPDLGGDAALRIETYDGLTAFLTDRLPLRDRAISAEAQFDDAVTFSDPIREDQPRGSDGWLNLAETLVDTCEGPPSKAFVAEIDHLAELAAAADVPFRFVVPPDKVQVYPEHLPREGLAGFLRLGSDDVPACAATWQTELDAAATTRPWFLPLAQPLIDAKGSTADPLFYKLDSHWTDAGSVHQAERLVSSLAPGLWDPAAVVPAAPEDHVGDLSRLRGLPESETVPTLAIQRPGVTVTGTQSGPGVGTMDINGIVTTTRASSTNGAAVIPGRTVIVGDSFLRASVHLLEPYFEELVYVPWQAISAETGNTLADLAGGPADALVVVQVQRSLSQGRYPRYTGALEAYLAAQP